MFARAATVALLVLCAGCTARGNGGAPPALRDMAALEDASGELAITDVADGTRAFEPVTGLALNAGYTSSAYWVRLTVDAAPGDWWLDVLPSFLDDLRLYEADATAFGGFRERRAGDVLPFASREVPYRGFVFRLQHPDASPRTYYLRVVTTSSLAILPRVSSPETFIAQAATEEALVLAGPVMLLTLMLLHLGSRERLRPPLTRWFLAFLTSFTVSYVSGGGLVYQFIVPDSPQANYLVIGVATLASIGLGAGFFRRLFGVTRQQRFLYWWFNALTWLPLSAIVPFVLLDPRWQVTSYAVASLPALNVTTAWLAIQQWWQGRPGGRPMLLAVMTTSVGTLSYAVTALGLWDNRGAFLYGVQLGSLGAFVALELAIAAQHERLEVERRDAVDAAAREQRVREQQGRFIGLISHEYRTPLAVLQTNLDILTASGEESQRHGAVQRMSVAVGRLRDLFAGMQQTSDWAGHRQIQIEAIDAVAVTRQVVAGIDATCPGLECRLTADAAPAVVHADATLLGMVLRSLLDNAAKYAVRDRPIDLFVGRDEGRTVIRIGNECARSPGVASDVLLRGSVRGANSTGQPGLGMGLHLARRLAADMGAELCLDLSQPLRFVVTLAFARMHEERAR